MLSKILLFIALLNILFSAQSTSKKVTNDGRVAFTATWNLDTSNQDNTSLFPSTSISDYNTGYITLPNFIQISSVNTNQNFKIKAHRGVWTIPTAYSNEGNKKTSGNPVDSDSDVKLSLSSISGMSAEGSYGTDYTVISNTPIAILGSSGSVSGASANVNLRIMMDWANDVEGNYGITITLTFVDE